MYICCIDYLKIIKYRLELSVYALKFLSHNFLLGY